MISFRVRCICGKIYDINHKDRIVCDCRVDDPYTFFVNSSYIYIHVNEERFSVMAQNVEDEFPNDHEHDMVFVVGGMVVNSDGVTATASRKCAHCDFTDLVELNKRS